MDFLEVGSSLIDDEQGAARYLLEKSNKQ
jgi:hypothetical protein